MSNIETPVIMKYLLLVTIFFLSLNSTFCYSLTDRIDSLKALILVLKEDTNKVNSLIELSRQYDNINLDIAIKYGIEAKSLSEKIDYPKGLFKSLELISYLHREHSNFEIALKYGIEAKSLSEKIDYPKGIASSSELIGSLFGSGKLAEKEHYLKQSLIIFRELGDQEGVYRLLNQLADVYNQLGYTEKSIEYYLKILDEINEFGDVESNIEILKKLSRIYYYNLSLVDKGVLYIKQALKISEDSKNWIDISDISLIIGDIYFLENNYDSALYFYEKSLFIQEKDDYETYAGSYFLNKWYIGYDHNNDAYKRQLDFYITNELRVILNKLGKVYLKKNDFVKAIEFHKKAYEKAQDQAFIYEEPYNYGLAESLKCLADVYSAQNNYKQARDNYLEAELLIKKSDGYVFEQDMYSGKDLEEIYQCLVNVFTKLSDYQNALKYQINLAKIGNLMNNESFEWKTYDIKMLLRYKNESDSILFASKVVFLETEAKNKNRIKKIYFGAIICVIIALIIVIYFIFKIRSQKNIIQKEKIKSDNLLLNILPSEVAEELKITGKSDARNFDNVSVLFTDFKEFTKIAETLKANELVEEIDTCFQAFDQIITNHTIEKIKTIGDAYMAAGGLNSPAKTAAKDVIMAGFNMLSFMKKRKEEQQKKDKPYFEMRVGIHTGPVVAGIVGVKKFQYDIWGDTVNIANCMERSGKIGRLNISISTYNLIKDDPDFGFEYRGKIQAKNKGELEMYFVDVLSHHKMPS